MTLSTPFSSMFSLNQSKSSFWGAVTHFYITTSIINLVLPINSKFEKIHGAAFTVNFHSF